MKYKQKQEKKQKRSRREAEEKQKRSSSRVRPTAGNAKKKDRRSIVQIDTSKCVYVRSRSL